jgi:hypothetical protein
VRDRRTARRNRSTAIDVSTRRVRKPRRRPRRCEARNSSSHRHVRGTRFNHWRIDRCAIALDRASAPMLTTAVGSRGLRTNTVRVELLRSCRGTTRHDSDYEHRCGSVSMEIRDLGKSEFNLHSVASCPRHKVMFRQRLSTKPADHSMTLSLHPALRNLSLVTSCRGCHGSSRRESIFERSKYRVVEKDRFRMQWTPIRYASR